jgi:oligoendopeptidase F
MHKNAKWKIISVILLVMVTISTMVAGCTQPQPSVTSVQIPKRSESPEQYRWDLTSFYENRETFESDVALLKEKYIPAMAAYQGKLNNANDLLALFKLDTETCLVRDNINVYSYLLADLDQTNTDATELVDIASGVLAEYNGVVAFIEPEILSLDDSVLASFLADPMLATYRYYLRTLVDRKEHVLSDKEEHILAAASEIAESPRNIFNKVMYADFTYPTITDKHGQEIQLDWAAYDNIMKDPDREYRKKAYDAMWEAYTKLNNTLSATYIASIKTDIFFSESRNYSSVLEEALAGEHLPRSVYDSLVSSTDNNLDYFHRYIELIKNTLGLDELHSYDMGLPLVKDYSLELPYDQATQIIAAALQPLGDEYVAEFNKGIQNRWVDVYPDDHKYTGGYQWGTYTSHPYILLNYDNSLDGALALAHEMGHALNYFYSNETQDYWNAGYTIFTAEVASMTNEFLVMDYLINNASSDEERLYLLLQELDYVRGGFYTQVMYSEFEQEVHARAESGEPLSAEALNNLWLELVQKYYGPDFTADEISGAGWSRIPHFYSCFYVYKYATSMAAARQIADDILAGKEGTQERYLTFLAAGRSDYPVELLKNAGVNMTQSTTVDNLLTYFGSLVNEADGLLQKN